jgi:hypothetical protein
MDLRALLKGVVAFVLYVVILSLSVILFAFGVALLPLRLLMSARSFMKIYLYLADYYWKFAVWFGDWVGVQFNLYGDDVSLFHFLCYLK